MEDRISKTMAVLLGCVLFLTTSRAADPSHPATKDWPTVGGGWGNSRYSALDTINTRNVWRLGAAWTSEKFDEGGMSRVTPVVKDGVMFVTAGRKVYALDAKTGVRLWSYKTIPDEKLRALGSETGSVSESLNYGDGVPNGRGVGLGGGLVLVGLTDGHLIALEEKTGRLRWVQQTGEQSKVGLGALVAPLYIAGKVVAGFANDDANLRGLLTELDAATGEEHWRFYSIPGPGESGSETWPFSNDVPKFGGGGVWTGLAADSRFELVFATTGNPHPMFAGDQRAGDNLYTSSVVAVDLLTGSLKWYYQLVHHDVFDADVGTPVILFDAEVNGKYRKALAVLRSDGFLFEFDRQTGEPIFPIEERPVPQLNSQATSPTQPFPVAVESILMSCEDWKREAPPPGFVLGCMWTAPASSTDPQNVLAPFPAARATPMAYSPKTGYFYAQGTSMLGWLRRSPDPFFFEFGSAIPGLKAYTELTAIDGRSGRIVWKRPIPGGAYGGLPLHLNGGEMVTAGGLLFLSLGDGNVAALDARSGAARWQFQTGMGGISGAPASYAIDGEQYIAVPMGPSVWAFKLGGKVPPANAPRASFEVDLSGPVQETDKVETTALKTTVLGSGTRYFVDENAFHPYRVGVKAGTRVLFVNNGNTQHEVVAVDGSWGTGPLSPSQEAWVSFEKPGEYTYICKDHPWVYGQIIVTTAGEPLSKQQTATDVRKTGEVSALDRDNSGPLEQTRMGKAQFERSCWACHGGQVGRPVAPPLLGAMFLLHWQGVALVDLVDRIRTTMPQGSPGSLDRDTCLAIAAYLLQANDAASVGGMIEPNNGHSDVSSPVLQR